MKGRAQKIRLGLFVLISGAFLLILVGFFTARRLFEPKDHYFVAYRDVSVSGLQEGSPVKYLGINVGTITDIRIDPEDVNRVILRLSLRAGTPVKEDAVADIVAMGITGFRAIEIRGGTQDAPFLEEGEYIQAGTSLVDDITGQAEVIAFKVEEVLNNLLEFTQPDNLEKISAAAENISRLADNMALTFSTVDELIAENRADVRNTMATVSQMSQRLDQTSDALLAASERVNEIMQGEDVAEVLSNLREISLQIRETDLNELIIALASAADQTQEILLKLETDLEHGGRSLGENLLLLQHTLENLNEASRKISADPSVLLRGQRTNRSAPDNLLQDR
jgi:phospholipid/cholesterol/gamma-HCH transport system substrate-binding protein